MKCQHCGINFDDSERECPICGARAGSRGRLAEPRRSTRPVREKPKKKQHQTFTKDWTSAGKKPSAAPTNGKRKSGGKAIAIGGILLLLLNILPNLLSLFVDMVDGAIYALSSSVEEPVADEPYEEDIMYEPGVEYPYDPDHYAFIYAALSDVTGSRATGVLVDGSTLELQAGEGFMSDYTLTIRREDGIYQEMGYSWASYNYPEEQIYSEAYPPEQYDSFSLCLTSEEASFDGGIMPSDYDMRLEDDDLWLHVYREKDSGIVVLEDIADSGMLGGAMYAELVPLENG
ncbi:hypothetical protein [Agathobaculum desmolans]|uniref:hypothetical protein n=1 Tax=Agathobaculum desmolans TaxID=39484 RepID=UPI0004E230C0|nr:hypothetical protein [Agathobaculum desmolans]